MTTLAHAATLAAMCQCRDADAASVAALMQQGPWLNRHGEHDRCSCGAQVAKGYLGQHRGSKARHGNPCPGWVKGGAR